MAKVTVTLESVKLFKDPEIRTLNSGKVISSVSVGVQPDYKRNPDIYDNYKLEFWGNDIDDLPQIKKGDVISVEGKLTLGKYKDRNTGEIKRGYDAVIQFAKIVGSEHQQTGSPNSGQNLDDVPF